MRRITIILSVFLVLLLGSGCSSGEMKHATAAENAILKLKEAIDSEFFWVQVHAYEFLQQLGSIPWPDSSFQSFKSQYESIPEKRIGVWRIAAKTHSNDNGNNIYLDSIRSVYLETTSSDRLHAAETLAKLGVSLKTIPKNIVQRDLDAGGSLKAYVLWGLSLPSSTEHEIDFEVLLEELEKNDPETSATIAYALTKIHSHMPVGVWNRIHQMAYDPKYHQFTRNRLKIALYLYYPEEIIIGSGFKDLKTEILDLLENTDSRLRYAGYEALGLKGTNVDPQVLESGIEGVHSMSSENNSIPDFKRINLDVQSAAAFAILKLSNHSGTKLGSLDWIVIVLFLVVMLGIGFYYSRKDKSSEDYFLGGRTMNPFMVGLSLFATLLSTLSYLAYPGEMIKHGPVMFLGLLAYPFAYIIISKFIIPEFMKLNVTSAYEVLELKLGNKVRDLGTFFFLLLRFLWMSTILYATVNTALIHIMGFGEVYVPWVCLAMALITIVYTAMGGIKAVVLTDTIQSIVLWAGAILSIVIISYNFGSFTSWLPNEWLPHWQEIVWKVDLNERMTFGNIFIMVLLWKVCTSGSDQMAVQRYLSTRDLKSARSSLGISLWASALVQITLGILGLAVAAYFLEFPQQLQSGTTVYDNADSLFPRFILIGLPPSISGFVVAGIMAAAMSSLSSGLNSSSSVISEDVLDRHFPNVMKNMNSLKKVRIISIAVGIVVSISSMFVGYIEGNLLDVVIKVVNLVVAPLFVLFFMALFVPSATDRGTFLGGIFSLLVAILIAFFGLFNLSVLTIMPVSLVAGIASAWIFSKLG